MSVTLIIGSQWGDEGKGKIIDFLAQKSDIVVRFHGGNNAGHTVINEFGKFPLHLIPSGIFAKSAVACITNGTVLDLEVLVEEISLLEKSGVKLQNKLYISPRCHIILPYHKLLEKAYENAKGKTKTGSTGRGIGPVYADKVSYNGIRLVDVQNKKHFLDKLAVQLSVKNKILKALGEKTLSKKEIAHKTFSLYKKLSKFIFEPYPLLYSAMQKNKNILLEGAQGVFLDNDWGTYPFATASTVLSGGSNAGAGIPPQKITDVLGVVKAYTTRVGGGPFPTELFDNYGEKLREIGKEYGATTGRPRRCGWFDAELIRFAAQINGFTGIAITKLDILDNFEEIKICTGYTYKGKRIKYFEADAKILSQVKPIYKTMRGWKSSTFGIKEYKDLPPLAKEYLKELERLIDTPVKYISTGPERNAIITR